MVKRDERGPRFDDGTSKNEIGGPEGDNATLVDEALGQEVAIKLRELRKEMAKQSSAKAEKPTFTEEDFPRLYSEDDAPTMWEVNSGPSIMELEQQTIEAPAYAEGTLGSAIPVVLSDDAEHTQRSEIPIIEPIKPPPLEERAEYTRKEPIPMELFFETSEQ